MRASNREQEQPLVGALSLGPLAGLGTLDKLPKIQPVEVHLCNKLARQKVVVRINLLKEALASRGFLDLKTRRSQ